MGWESVLEKTIFGAVFDLMAQKQELLPTRSLQLLATSIVVVWLAGVG